MNGRVGVGAKITGSLKSNTGTVVVPLEQGWAPPELESFARPGDVSCCTIG